MSTRSPTTTSYAILGLLAIQPWATYDLAKLMRRSLHFFWPRAESNLYAETKRLVDGVSPRHGKSGTVTGNGRCTRSPTEGGTRSASGSRHHRPSARVESEAHLRLLYANYGSKDDLLATIQWIEDDARRTIDHYAQLGTEYARGEGLFPDRIHVNALLASLSIEQARATVRWARRSRGAVEAWETTEQPDVEWAVKTLVDAAREPQDD